jgi:hypothetical protein
MMSKHHIILNCTMNDLMQDIRATEDPIRKIILKKFLDLKSREMMAASEDPSLDGISDTEYVDDKLEKEIVQKIDAPKKVRQIKKNVELDHILKKQKESLSELDNLNKKKAYMELIEDNNKAKDNQDIEQHRGKTERIWGSTYDPRYIKYAKEDTMNNKVMERLNSEIEFRNDDGQRTHIEKPFDDGVLDATEPFARYEATNDEKKRYVPKKKPHQKIGQRKFFY